MLVPSHELPHLRDLLLAFTPRDVAAMRRAGANALEVRTTALAAPSVPRFFWAQFLQGSCAGGSPTERV